MLNRIKKFNISTKFNQITNLVRMCRILNIFRFFYIPYIAHYSKFNLLNNLYLIYKVRGKLIFSAKNKLKLHKTTTQYRTILTTQLLNPHNDPNPITIHTYKCRATHRKGKYSSQFTVIVIFVCLVRAKARLSLEKSIQVDKGKANKTFPNLLKTKKTFRNFVPIYLRQSEQQFMVHNSKLRQAETAPTLRWLPPPPKPNFTNTSLSLNCNKQCRIFLHIFH